jgi:hypothetical protein
MKRAAIIGIMIAVMNVFFSSRSLAESDDWSEVKKIPIDKEWIVEMKGGMKYKGRIVKVTNSSLKLWGRNGSIDIQANEIEKIRQPRLNPAKTALVGAGGGILVGFIIGAKGGYWDENHSADKSVKWLGISTAVGAVAGVTAGFVVGIVSNVRRPFYRKSNAGGRKQNSAK